MNDELMTRREARQRDAEDECRREGHDLEVSQAGSWAHGPQPLGIRCDRCGESWGVAALGTPFVVMYEGKVMARVADVALACESAMSIVAWAVANDTDGNVPVTVIDERLPERENPVLVIPGNDDDDDDEDDDA